MQMQAVQRTHRYTRSRTATATQIQLRLGHNMNIKTLFFGTILTISGGIIAGGLIGEWWAFAILLPAGAYLGWTLGERKQRNP